jgi:proteasome lid subunit RPN8/RPN11
MNKETMDLVKADAINQYPKESCGLIAVVKGRMRYFPSENNHEKGSDHFIITDTEYSIAEDAGEIIAVVHSHPDEAAKASEGDRVACEKSKLPWYIVSVRKQDDGTVECGEMNLIQPEGYEAPLVGRSFHHGVLDCYTLIQDYYKRELGITLMEVERHDEWWNDGVSNLYLDNMEKAGFRKLKDGEPIQKGDVIYMTIESKNGNPNHAGVYLEDNTFLHHYYNRLSSRDPYGGYWQLMTSGVGRHKDMENKP